MKPEELIQKLTGAITLDQQVDTEFVSTGSFAINKAITGKYDGGVPIGAITQFRGAYSSGKSLFALSIIAEAQKKDFHVKFLDAENALSKPFAETLGVNTSVMQISNPETVEDAFEDMERTILGIRELDKETPIVLVLDSIAVLAARDELISDKERAKGGSNYEQNPMQGAQRAKVIGTCLRRFHPLVKKHNACVVIINQLRSKVGVMYGSPDTIAAGGRSLEFYLAVDIHLTSNKGDDVLKNEDGDPFGITGKIKVNKNKCSIPFKSCLFKVIFDKGLDPLYGIFDDMLKEGLVEQVNSKGAYKIGNTPITMRKSALAEDSVAFSEFVYNDISNDATMIRGILNIGD